LSKAVRRGRKQILARRGGFGFFCAVENGNAAGLNGGKLRGARLGLLPVVGQCFSIGPLIDVALFLGIVAAMAGAVGPLAVLLAALGMVAFSMVVAFYASETGGAGAVGDYVSRAWGPWAGTGALGVYLASLLFSGAAGFMVAVGELAQKFASVYFGADLPWWAFALAVGAAALWLNVRGAGMATHAQLAIIAVSVVPFLLTAVAAVINAGPANTLAVFSWNNPHGGDLFGALLFCILLFGGFETAGALAEETADPKRNIPLALVGTVGAAALLLVFCSYAGTVHYGPERVAKDWGGAMDGYAQMAEELVGGWAALWIRLAVLVDFTATCIGFTVAASRGIYSLARAGKLPRGLAATNRHGAPARAAWVVFGCAVFAVACGMLVPAGGRFDTLFVVATAQALLLVLVYTALALGALKLMATAPRKQPLWRWVVFPAAAVVPGLALYGTFVPFPDFPERYGLFAGFAALGLVAAWLAVLRMRGRA
jgi:amino acid transporter